MSFVDKYASKGNSANQILENKKSESQQGVEEKKSSPINEKQQNSINQNLNKVSPEKRMKAELIYLVKGVDAGRNAWYYVLVDRLKVQLFLKALNDDIIHLEEYGSILYSAYGDEPPEDVTSKLKAEYGIK